MFTMHDKIVCLCSIITYEVYKVQHDPVPKVWLITPASTLLLGNGTTTEHHFFSPLRFSLLTILAISYREIHEKAFEKLWV